MTTGKVSTASPLRAMPLPNTLIEKQSPGGVFRNFTKFTGKHLCQSLFFYKVAGLRPASLLKKRFWHKCFPVNFVKFLRTPIFTEHLRWLLLLIHKVICHSWLSNCTASKRFAFQTLQ